MRILLFPRLQQDIDKFWITVWREMCSALRSKGHNVKIAIAGTPIPGIFDAPYIHVPIIHAKFFRLITFWALGFLKFIVHYSKFRPDVLVLDIFTIWFGLIPAIFADRRRCLIVLDNRTPFYNEASAKSTTRDILFRLYTRLAYNYCQLLGGVLTTVTQYHKECISRDFKIDPSIIGVWGNGADILKFNTHNYPACENRFPWTGKFVVMLHGEMSYNRGIFESIRAMSLIKENNIALVLIGSAINNDKIDIEIDALIHTLDLSQKVHRIPYVPHGDIPRYLSSADCAIMAYPNIEYWNNNNPVKLSEYLSMGKVIICPLMWTFQHVCGTAKCAVYIDNNKPDIVADAIVYCYKHRDMMNEWGSEGIKIVKERFTWQIQAENLMKFIQDIKNNNENIND